MSACDRCWEGRHCRGRDCDSCSVCADVVANRFEMGDRDRAYRAKVVKEKSKPKPRKYVYKYRPSPVPVPQPTVPMLPAMEAAIVEQLQAGASVMYVVNHTNFTERQVKAVQARMGHG